MARFTFDGVDLYVRQLEQLNAKTPEILGKAVYAGAAVVADAVRANIDALPAVPDGVGAHAFKEGTGVPLTESAKEGLQEGFGISRMLNRGGYHHVKLGFHGYNNLKTRKFPNGQPNLLVARSLENGSSISRRHAFVKPAVRASKSACEAAMARVLEQEIERVMN